IVSGRHTGGSPCVMVSVTGDETGEGRGLLAGLSLERFDQVSSGDGRGSVPQDGQQERDGFIVELRLIGRLAHAMGNSWMRLVPEWRCVRSERKRATPRRGEATPLQPSKYTGNRRPVPPPVTPGNRRG